MLALKLDGCVFELW